MKKRAAPMRRRPLLSAYRRAAYLSSTIFFTVLVPAAMNFAK
jgi:hypothetical protein